MDAYTSPSKDCIDYRETLREVHNVPTKVHNVAQKVHNVPQRMHNLPTGTMSRHSRQ